MPIKSATFHRGDLRETETMKQIGHLLRGSLMPSSALVNSSSPQSMLFDGASQLTVMASSLIVGSKGLFGGLAQSGSSALCVVTVFSWSVHRMGPVGALLLSSSWGTLMTLQSPCGPALPPR